MNSAHFHLAVNHLPLILPIAGVIVMITGQMIKSEVVKRTAYLLFILGALTTIAAMTSGEGAEEIVEKIPGVSENYIETHEESAEVFALMSYLLGGISLFGLWVSFKERTYSGLYSIGVLVYALIVMFFAKETGTTGGEIRHTEIRSDVAGTVPVNANEEED